MLLAARCVDMIISIGRSSLMDHDSLFGPAMIRRAITLATANWALLILPCICTGGYLRHACDCVDGADSGCCESEIECSCDLERSGCGHESSCDKDPCEFVVVARQEDASTLFAIGISPPICFAAPVSSGPAGRPEFDRCELFDSARRSKQIPFHESDVPLLI